jgi:hypothetical protein
MRYICLGYMQPGKFESITESERQAMLDECFAYDDQLRANGHFAGGEALQPPHLNRTLQTLPLAPSGYYPRTPEPYSPHSRNRIASLNGGDRAASRTRSSSSSSGQAGAGFL